MASITSTDLTTGALRLLAEVTPGETLSDEELADGLAATNLLLESLSAEQALIPIVTHETFALNGAASYTIGAANNANGGSLASKRPLRILCGSTVDTAGASHPLHLATAAEWEAIPDKTRTGLFAEALFSDNGFPQATLCLSPKPGAGSLILDSLKLLTGFADLTTAVEMAPGHIHYLKHHLAAVLAPEYGRDPNMVAGELARARAAVIVLNAQSLGPVTPLQMPQASQPPA